MARPRVTEVEAALDAAARMIADQGIATTTVDDIAAEAGVSRATVYRYLGGKDEIVAAVIGRETERLLAEIEDLVPGADTAPQLIESMVVTAVRGVEASPVLQRLVEEDLRRTLPFLTLDAASLIDLVVETLAAALRDGLRFEVDTSRLDTVLEESARLVLSHLTTPRRSVTRLESGAFAERVATMVVPLLGT